jgi:hypothetical protein
LPPPRFYAILRGGALRRALHTSPDRLRILPALRRFYGESMGVAGT